MFFHSRRRVDVSRRVADDAVVVIENLDLFLGERIALAPSNYITYYRTCTLIRLRFAFVETTTTRRVCELRLGTSPRSLCRRHSLLEASALLRFARTPHTRRPRTLRRVRSHANQDRRNTRRTTRASFVSVVAKWRESRRANARRRRRRQSGSILQSAKP